MAACQLYLDEHLQLVFYLETIFIIQQRKYVVTQLFQVSLHILVT